MKKLGMATIVNLLGWIGLSAAAASAVGFILIKKKVNNVATTESDTDNEKTEVTDE